MADIVNILTLVLKAMVSVECIIKLSGDEKKHFVITFLEKQLQTMMTTERSFR